MRLALVERNDFDGSSLRAAATSSLGSVGTVLASATSTSPLGSTYILRGLSSPAAYCVTRKPVGTVGISACGHSTILLRLVTDSVA